MPLNGRHHGGQLHGHLAFERGDHDGVGRISPPTSPPYLPRISPQAITTVWVTMVIIASNVVIFNLVPYFAVRRERQHGPHRHVCSRERPP